MLFVVLVGVYVHFGMDVDMFLMLMFLVVLDGVDVDFGAGVAMFLMLVKT